MDECQHLELEKTVDKTNDGAPIYYCKAKCGVGLLVVRPLVITVQYGRPTAIPNLPEVTPAPVLPAPVPENILDARADRVVTLNAQTSNTVTDNVPQPPTPAICGHTETAMGVQTGRTCKLPANHDAGDSLIAHEY